MSVVLIGFGASPASAQSGTAPAESAVVARVAWRAASAALERRDLREARAQVHRAARAWPAQPSYHWAEAVLAARDSDASALERSLSRYADLGLGRDLRANPSFAPLLGDRFAPLAGRHDANRAPLARSTARRLLADSTFWPEGLDADPRTGTLYVASVRHRTVAEIAPDGTTRELLARDRSDLAPVLGVRVDTARNSLWITTSALRNVPGFRESDSANASLLRIDLATRTIRQRFDVPLARGGHVLGDLAVGADGSVYVTDSREPVIYRLAPGAAMLEELRSPLFSSLQGVAPTPDGKLLYVADYSLGLLRMNLATGAVAALANPANGTAVGCDGIVWFDGAIIAVQNGVEPARVVRLVPDTIADRVLRVDVIDQNVAVADEPTIGTMLGTDFVYVANSQWARFTDDARRDVARPLTAPIALRVPLRR